MRSLLLMSLLLAALPARPQSAPRVDGSVIDEGPGYRLYIAPWRIRLIHERSALASLCRTRKWIFACTDFVGARLDCDCAPDAAQWRLDARAQVIPFLYLGDITQLPHERRHIDDVREGIVAHLQRLAAIRFPSAAACGEASMRTRATFGEELNRILLASNHTRH